MENTLFLLYNINNKNDGGISNDGGFDVIYLTQKESVF